MVLEISAAMDREKATTASKAVVGGFDPRGRRNAKSQHLEIRRTEVRHYIRHRSITRNGLARDLERRRGNGYWDYDFGGLAE